MSDEQGAAIHFGPYRAEQILSTVGTDKLAFSVFKKRPDDVQTTQNWVDDWEIKYPPFPGEPKMSRSHATRAARMLNEEESELNKLRNLTQTLHQYRPLVTSLLDTAGKIDDLPDVLSEIVSQFRDAWTADQHQPFINVAQLILMYRSTILVLDRAVRSMMQDNTCKVCGALSELDKPLEHRPDCWVQDAAILVAVASRGQQ